METKKRKTVLWVVAGVIVAVAVLGAIYSYLAFMPSGYNQIEKPIAEARERVVKMGSPRMVAAPVRAVAQTSSSAQTRADAAAPPKNFIGEIQNFDDTGSGFFLEYFVHRNIARGGVEFGLEPANPSDLWSALSEKQRYNLLGLIHYRIVEVEQQFQPVTENDKAFVNSELDRIEQFLLRPHDGMPEGMNPTGLAMASTYHAKALMAIERACQRGDPHWAMQILDGYLETLRLMGSVYLHDATIRGLYPVDYVLFFWDGLSSIPNLPPEWRNHVRATLNDMSAMKFEPNDVWLYSAARWRSTAQYELQQRAYLKNNTWHFFLGGRLESMTYTAMTPVANRQIDLMAMAISRGDQAACERQYTAIKSTQLAMNMDGGMDWNRDMMEGMHNRPIELTSYAASIRAILDEDRGTTISIPVAKFADLPYYNGSNWGLWAARDKWVATHGRAPMMPEEVETFLKESGYGDEWRKLVTWHEPRKYNVWRAKPNPEDLRTTKTIAVRVQFKDPDFEGKLKSVLMWKEKKN